VIDFKNPQYHSSNKQQQQQQATTAPTHSISTPQLQLQMMVLYSVMIQKEVRRMHA
jgi:hypothetical protein